MLLPFHKDRYDGLESVKQLTDFPIIHSVIQKTQSGWVYVDDIEAPEVIFVLHKSGFGYVYNSGAAFNAEAFASFIRHNEDVPQYFHLYEAPQQFVEYVKGDKALGYKVRERVQLRYKKSGMLDIQTGEYELNEITADNLSLLENAGLKLDSTFWNSQEDFVTNGLGVFLSAPGGIPASICYAASIAGNVAEVDVLTLEDYRNKGLGKSATAGFINACTSRGIVPNWDCFSENTGSLKIAQSLGFEEAKRYDFLSVFVKEK